MYGIERDTVLERDQNPTDQFAMVTEKLTNYSELFPGQPVPVRRMDEKNSKEAAVGVLRGFAHCNTASASRPSTEAPYHACACGPRDAVSAVSPSSKHANSFRFSLRENSKNFIPLFLGNE